MDLIESPNIPEITRFLVRLAAAQRIPELSEATLAEYLETLAKCKVEEVEQACEDAKHKLDRFPSIHQLLDLMGIDTGPRSVEEEAGFMFDEIRRMRKTDFDLAVFNPVVSNCIRVMGGRGKLPGAFLAWDQKQEWEKRQQFIRNYKEFSKKHGRQTVLVVKISMIEEKKEFSMTAFERLQANRAAFECSRQAQESKRTGKNCFDREKVRMAQTDSSKDPEIEKKYGTHAPNPAEIFGNVGR